MDKVGCADCDRRGCTLPQATAVPTIDLRKWVGAIDLSQSVSPFALEGNSTHLGDFTALGEVQFVPVGTDGSALGSGAVVFEAANWQKTGEHEWIPGDQSGPHQFAS